jgi:dolichol-phosphate mannosyltransferase
MVATNVTGTVALMEECRAHGFEAFVNTGSSSEYGWKDHAPTEDEVLDPNSAYAATKAAATHYCRQAALAEGLPVRTLRLYSAYGPWEDPRRLIPTLLAHARNGELPPLAAPDTARDFVYVEDVCDAYLLAARTAGQESGAIYNVGSGTQTSLRDIVDLARRLFGVADEPQWNTIPSRTWDTGIWVADAGKIRATLGWTPQTSLEAGLLRTMEAGED